MGRLFERIYLTGILIFVTVIAFGQKLDYSYRPCSLSADNEVLIAFAENKFLEDKAWAKQTYSNKDVRYKVLESLEGRFEAFKEMLEDGTLISDGELVDYVQGILNDVALSMGETKHFHVLLVRRESPNAFNAGDDFIFVHLGLLTRLNSADELAFVLAHELAHNEREHFIQSVEAYATLQSNDSIQDKLRSIRRAEYGHVTAMNKLLAPWILSSRERSRKCENEADSLAFEAILRAGYIPAKALRVFDILGFGEHENDTLVYDLRTQLRLKNSNGAYDEAFDMNYESSLGAFEKEIDTLEDLMRTHPHAKDRKLVFEYRIDTLDGNAIGDDQGFLKMKYKAQTELLASLMYTDQIDRAILLSLSFLRADPNHAFAMESLPLCFAYLGYSKMRRHMGKLVGLNSNNHDQVYNELIYFIRAINPEQSFEIAETLLDAYKLEGNSSNNAVMAIFDLKKKDQESFNIRLETEVQHLDRYYSTQILNRIKIQ